MSLFLNGWLEDVIPVIPFQGGPFSGDIRSFSGGVVIQERYNTPRYRTPQAIPLANYERNPFMACW